MGAVIVAVVGRPSKARAAERRRRYALDAPEQGRIPLAPPRTPQPAAPPDEADVVGFTPKPAPSARLFDARPEAGFPGGPERDDEPPAAAVTGRLVMTPDGEEIITTPPFALRPQMLGRRLGRYCNGLSRRLPAWVVACPRVRLESLVTPTPPDGRDPEDWTRWRRRVRMRAVDIVICDRRTWRPLVAVMLEPPAGGRFGRRGSANGTATALLIAGGQDRMIDEVLGHVGLPLVRGSGDLSQDWAVLEPYVDEAILRSVGDDEYLAATDAANSTRLDPDAAVNLLKMDGDEGWALE
jgi:hypothetical protein